MNHMKCFSSRVSKESMNSALKTDDSFVILDHCFPTLAGWGGGTDSSEDLKKVINALSRKTDKCWKPQILYTILGVCSPSEIDDTDNRMRAPTFALYNWSGVQGGRPREREDLAGREQWRKKGKREGKGEEEEEKEKKNLNKLENNVYSKCLLYHFVSGLEAIMEELHLI